MLKKFLLVLVLLLSLQLVLACDEPIDCDSLTLDLTISGYLDLEATNGGSIDYLKTTMTYVPKNTYRENVLSLDYTPAPMSEDSDEVVFYWKTPPITRKEYSLNSEIITRNAYLPVKTKQIFPLKNLPEEVYDYTRPSKLIDTNEDIRNLASELAAGKTDEFVVVAKLAEWVNQNVEYDLNSVTADATQKSSWVLENRVGVCDEITNLFISMCRSLGIPARFVSGISYTNLAEFDNPWGPHGWAEVYFPDVGWVPFDATYGEYGYLDATHIKLKQGVDSDKSTVSYEWRAYNVDITAGKIDTVVDVIQKDGFVEQRVSILTTPYKNRIEFGSYNLITAEVSNLKNHYVAQEYALSVPKEIQLISPKKQLAIILPRRSTKLFWIVKVPSTLSKNYVYTFPFTVYDQQNDTSSSEFIVERDGTTLSLDFLKRVIEEQSEDIEKPYSKEISLNCDYPQKVEEKTRAQISCTIMNNGTELLSKTGVCLENDCKYLDLGSKDEKQVIFYKNFTERGQIITQVNARHALINKYFYLNIFVYDLTRLSIVNITAPTNTDFDETFDIEFVLKRESVSMPTNVNVTLMYNANKQVWGFESIKTSEYFRFSMPANLLKEGNNTFLINVEYAREDGERVKEAKEFQIVLNKLTLSQRINMWINQLGLYIERMMSK